MTENRCKSLKLSYTLDFEHAPPTTVQGSEIYAGYNLGCLRSANHFLKASRIYLKLKPTPVFSSLASKMWSMSNPCRK